MTDEEIEQLLPWYINDTLEAEEKAAVEALLDRSESARAELAFLRSLSQQIVEEERPAPSELGWYRLKRELRQSQPSVTQRWWRPGVAAAAAVIMALQVMIVTQQPEPYDATLLGNPVQQAEQSGWLLQIQFDPGYSWEAISTTIHSMQGRIVDGPSSLGIVRVQVPKDQAQFPTKAQLLAWLEQQTGITHAAIEAP